MDGRSPAMIAADYGQAAIIEYLITKGVTALDTPDKHGITPLLAAIFEGHTHCVKILLNAVSQTRCLKRKMFNEIIGNRNRRTL